MYRHHAERDQSMTIAANKFQDIVRLCQCFFTRSKTTDGNKMSVFSKQRPSILAFDFKYLNMF